MTDAEPDPGDLTGRAYRGLAIFIAAMAILLFLPAWTLAWWPAWLYLAVFAGVTFATTAYFLKHDRELVRHRMNVGPIAEKEPRQKMIQSLLSLVMVLFFVVPALDRHFGWSSVPPVIVLAADVVFVLGYWVIFRTLLENSFASSIIEVRQGQRVISTGPYAVVRHPMYAGALLMFLATPIALGSWWGLLVLILAIAGIASRLLDEERFLVRDLPGYEDYRRTTPYRLVPLVW